MNIIEKIDKYLDESNIKELMKDPLYKAVIKAKTDKERKKALETLKSIRGSSSVEILKKALKNEK